MRIGLKYPAYAKETETGTAVSYSNGAVLAKAISADLAINYSDVEVYADDSLDDTDQSFEDGTIALETNDIPDAGYVGLLGATEERQRTQGLALQRL